MILDELINEAYIGKTPGLEKMEDTIKQLRNRIGTKGAGTSVQLLKGLESCDEILKIKKILEDEFGFYSVTLNIQAVGFASTAPLHLSASYWSKMSDSIAKATKNKKAIKFSKDAELCVIINLSPQLLFSNTLTPGEITAVILHEVGHNFEFVLLQAMQIPNALVALSKLGLNMVFNPVYMLQNIFYFCATGRELFAGVHKKIFENPVFEPLINTLYWLIQLPVIGSSFIISLVGNIVKINTKQVIDSFNPVALFYSQDSYKSEKFADSFVSLVGYGPEFAMAVKKDTYMYDEFGTQRAIGNVPILGHIIGLWGFFCEHLFSLIEGHPDTGTRVLTGINLLKEDLKQTKFDKKTKALIEKDIKMMEQAHSDWTKVRSNMKSFDTNEMRTREFLNNLVSAVFPEGDIRSKVINWIGAGKNEIIKSTNQFQKPNFM